MINGGEGRVRGTGGSLQALNWLCPQKDEKEEQTRFKQNFYLDKILLLFITFGVLISKA